MSVIGDNHIHTSISVDSEESILQCVKRAIELNLKYITFTEHVDWNKADYGYGYYDYEKYNDQIEIAKEKFASRIKILKGIEFGEPHVYKLEFEEELTKNYDVILGSIHWFGKYFYGDQRLINKYGKNDLLKMYYEDLLLMIDYGNFDVMAHMDFPKRYFAFDCNIIDLEEQVLKSIIKKDIALEINTSGFRKGYNKTMPEASIIKKYLDLGGKKVSIGSDAHVCTDIARDFHKIQDINMLEQLVFVDRKEEIIK